MGSQCYGKLVSSTYVYAGNMANFTVLSWNVRGLNSAIKRSLVLKYIQQHNPKICILQETHLVGTRILGLR